MLAFPLRSGGDPAFGALALRFDAPAPRPEMAEIELLHIAADVCTQTVLRLRAEASSAERLRQIEFLSSASEQLARSLDHRATMRRSPSWRWPRSPTGAACSCSRTAGCTRWSSRTATPSSRRRPTG